MIRKISKFAAIFLVFHMIMVSGLSQSVWAAMISTESIIHVDRCQSHRDCLNNLLARAEIQAVLISHGIEPQEAQTRIDHLSDNEINRLVHEIEQLPAGGDHLAPAVMSIIFIIVMLIDIFFNEPTEK